MLEVDEKDVSYSAGKFSVPGTDIAPVTFAKVARMAYVGHRLPDGMEPGLDETVFYDPTGMGAPSGIHMAYVEVDPETGIVDILDYVAVDDVGTHHQSAACRRANSWRRRAGHRAGAL